MAQQIEANRSLPLFFLNNVIQTDSVLTEYSVCEAMERVINPSNIIGSQKIQNVWRVYVSTSEARYKLLQQGISLNGQHIQLFNQNPASTNQINRHTQPVKIIIKDVPISYSND